MFYYIYNNHNITICKNSCKSNVFLITHNYLFLFPEGNSQRLFLKAKSCIRCRRIKSGGMQQQEKTKIS